MAEQFPNLTPDSQFFGIRYNTQISTSDISGISQVVELPGARWRGSIGFTDLTPNEAALLQVFLLKLRGSSNLFLYGDLSRTSPQAGTIGGSPVVVGGSTRRVVKTTVTSGSFTSGDYIQIGTTVPELKLITNANNTGGNNWDLTIEPALRGAASSYTSNAIITESPKGQFRLVNEDQLGWAVRGKAYLTDINLEFIEFFT